MNEASLLEYRERVQKLRREDLHELRAEALELVLLDKLVQIDAKQLKNQAQMLSVDKGILQPQQMMVIVLVHLFVQLGSG